ncbi:SUMF1/EgtB/PvdO family nonheme iron enzyme [Nostoc sp.]|uniref:SUMF1/EgtB/PvdO family nonheme iron enzyme n=1 Tax=Nostoc sp. TaxID=1180 RepID=UPI002FFCBA3E
MEASYAQRLVEKCGKLYSWDNHLVYSVSWYEAEVYLQFVGKRLPTEAESEKAVSWDAQTNNYRTSPWEDEEPTVQRFDCVGVARRRHRLICKTTAVDAYPTG